MMREPMSRPDGKCSCPEATSLTQLPDRVCEILGFKAHCASRDVQAAAFVDARGSQTFRKSLRWGVDRMQSECASAKACQRADMTAIRCVLRKGRDSR